MAGFPVEQDFLRQDPMPSGQEVLPHFKRWLEATRKLPGADVPQLELLSGDTLTPRRSYVLVQPESKNSSELARIALDFTFDGMELFVQAYSAEQPILVKRVSGDAGIDLAEKELKLAADRHTWLHLKRMGTRWVQIGDGMSSAKGSSFVDYRIKVDSPDGRVVVNLKKLGHPPMPELYHPRVTVLGDTPYLVTLPECGRDSFVIQLYTPGGKRGLDSGGGSAVAGQTVCGDGASCGEEASSAAGAVDVLVSVPCSS